MDILFQNKKCLVLDSFNLFQKQQLTCYIWWTLPNPLPRVDTPFIVRDLFLDPGKMLCHQPRHELKENVYVKHCIYRAPVRDAVELESLTEVPAWDQWTERCRSFSLACGNTTTYTYIAFTYMHISVGHKTSPQECFGQESSSSSDAVKEWDQSYQTVLCETVSFSEQPCKT